MTKTIPIEADAFPELLPGDVLLYASRSLVGFSIRFRTWSDVEHIEVYAGDCKSIASRNGIGVNKYLFRAEGLRYVLRPAGLSPEQFAKGVAWFKTVQGQPYNWGDLLRFYLVDVDTKGMICSQFGAEFFRACEHPLFSPDYPAGSESPRDYQVTRDLKIIWSYLCPSTNTKTL